MRLGVHRQRPHPASGSASIKERLDRLSGVRDWRLHDCRRTAVTQMAGAGFPPHVADRLLNHVEGAIRGVAAVYQRGGFLPEREVALKAWARHRLACAKQGAEEERASPSAARAAS
jgi:hypothetical protein